MTDEPKLSDYVVAFLIKDLIVTNLQMARQATIHAIEVIPISRDHVNYMASLNISYQWSRLASLPNLLAATEDGFRVCTPKEMDIGMMPEVEEKSPVHNYDPPEILKLWTEMHTKPNKRVYLSDLHKKRVGTLTKKGIENG